MRAFENCLVCGASTENTHSARKGKDALVCGGTCYRQASRNFKRHMNGYKVARVIDLLAQIGGPVTAAQLVERYHETYGKSAMMGFNNSVALTQQLVPIVNPETIRVDKSSKPFTFEYLSGDTISDWLKPSMLAKYESVSFRSESDSYEWEWDRTDYAPTELIKKRLKNAGFSMTSGETTYKDQTVEFYEPQLVAPNGVVLEVCLSQNEEFDGFSRLTFFENDHSGDVGKTPDIDWNILHENGLLKGEDSVEQPQGDYYQVYWCGLYDEWKNGHNCADNAKFDIYEDNFIVMECNTCGRTATFRQEGPYEGPRTDKQMFGAEEEEEEEEEELKQYSVTVPVLHYYSFEPVEAYDEEEAADEVRNNWGYWRRTIEDNGDWGGPLWRYGSLSSHEPEAHEIFDSETFGSESQQELEVSVGDRVRSYDFILPDGTLIRDDCYMEGRVTKIAPVEWCGSECDHYYILVDRVVRNGEEIDSKTFTDGQMVFPPVSESYLEVLTETFDVEFNDWADQEMMTHGKDVSFKEWAEEEGEKHGDMDLTDWAKEEEESHDERYESESREEYKGPFEVEIRRPNGEKASWKKYDTFEKLYEALEDLVNRPYTPYAIDVFAGSVPYITGFSPTGAVTGYGKSHLGTFKYNRWESGPWADVLPQPEY